MTVDRSGIGTGNHGAAGRNRAGDLWLRRKDDSDRHDRAAVASQCVEMIGGAQGIAYQIVESRLS